MYATLKGIDAMFTRDKKKQKNWIFQCSWSPRDSKSVLGSVDFNLQWKSYGNHNLLETSSSSSGVGWCWFHHNQTFRGFEYGTSWNPDHVQIVTLHPQPKKRRTRSRLVQRRDVLPLQWGPSKRFPSLWNMRKTTETWGNWGIRWTLGGDEGWGKGVFLLRDWNFAHLGRRMYIHTVYIYIYIHTVYIYMNIYKYIYIYIHTLHYFTLLYITLHYTTLHYIALYYITLHYITLHYNTSIHPYIHTSIHPSIHPYIHTVGGCFPRTHHQPTPQGGDPVYTSWFITPKTIVYREYIYIYMSIYLSIYMSIYLSIYLSSYLSIYI